MEYNTSCQKVSTRTQKYEISWLNAEIIARRLGMSEMAKQPAVELIELI